MHTVEMTARARLFPGSHVNGSSCEVSSLRLQAATPDKHFPEWSLEPARSHHGQAGIRQDLFPIWQRVSLRNLKILWFFAQGFPGLKLKTEIRRAAFCSPQRKNLGKVVKYRKKLLKIEKIQFFEKKNTKKLCQTPKTNKTIET